MIWDRNKVREIVKEFTRKDILEEALEIVDECNDVELKSLIKYIKKDFDDDPENPSLNVMFLELDHLKFKMVYFGRLKKKESDSIGDLPEEWANELIQRWRSDKLDNLL